MFGNLNIHLIFIIYNIYMYECEDRRWEYWDHTYDIEKFVSVISIYWI